MAIEPVSTVRTPPGLTTVERRIYRRYARELVAARVITALDLDALANFARALAQVLDIRWEQQERGHSRVTATGRALDAQLRHWMQVLRLAGAELGLSPMSRARVAPAGGGPHEEDEFDAYISKAPIIRRVK